MLIANVQRKNSLSFGNKLSQLWIIPHQCWPRLEETVFSIHSEYEYIWIWNYENKVIYIKFNWNAPRSIKFKSTKLKANHFWVQEEASCITWKEKPVQLSIFFSVETSQYRRERVGIFQGFKKDNCQWRVCYPAKPAFRKEMEILHKK